MAAFILAISKDTSIPLYQRIAIAIRDQIVRRELSPGSSLPTVRTMAGMLACTPGTVARAYSLLQQDGLLITRSGKGTQVRQTENLSIAVDNAVFQETGSLLRQARLVNRVESILLEMVGNGYPPGEIEAAFVMALARWRELAQQGTTPPETEAKSDLVFSGSHDLVVELLAHHLRSTRPPIHLETRFVGSLAGLMALAQDTAHLAGCHLMDIETGEYNRPTIRRLFPGRRVCLVTLARRQVGFIVAAGNPQHITHIMDFTRTNIRIANRQLGSGTRLLLDHLFHTNGIDPHQVAGYDQIHTTHLAVANAITTGQADVGLGVRAAASVWHLDFIPVTDEIYELAWVDTGENQVRFATLVPLLQSAEFSQTVATLGGYDTRQIGNVRIIDS
ncbi:MAG: GntR family transcriptional regulator [Chloroflexi bacterium]|nr:GntR family transcriptional regulator [Chloroflexota bacterium]